MTRAQTSDNTTVIPPAPLRFDDQAARLVADIDTDRWGSVDASVYETARVVSLTPGLTGHDGRLAWLLDQQLPDGSWGEGPARYRLLPTLSAVEALLRTALRDDTAAASGRARLAAAAAGGLAALRRLPAEGPWPDTAAIEILVPHLFARINSLLDQPLTGALPHLGPLARGSRPGVPSGFRPQRHEEIAQRCLTGVPGKLHHTFEGIAPYLSGDAVDAADGLLGSSPAATAAWLATRPADARSERASAALSVVARRYGGLFPEAAPIRVFERLWVTAALAGTGVPSACRAAVRTWAHNIYDPAGVRGAPGLLPDADDTAMAVLVTALTGVPRDPAPLAAFWAGTHYRCYLGEDTGSLTANAHALRALTAHGRSRPAEHAAHRPHRDLVRDWLLERQSGGAWTDKWHASPYYATERCVRALLDHGGPGTSQAVRAAVDWVLDSQHDDGTWGIWGGTAEETAYAVKILLADPAASTRRGWRRVLQRAGAALDTAHGDQARHPALWHDKTLYAPTAMIRAEIITARELLRRGLGQHTEGAAP
ncbi:prenyltransferase/squalene oxidase repeat-containing protein [Streptomyces sp. NPDC058861]|uniref:prenyltransferase/squalene oxidase repeat-containing protein n=1 Tax=Streptomyces sp. NPDC058861 TaxID=3346653 RepID=UPI0036AB38DA